MLSWVKWALSFCALALFAAGAFVCVAKLVRAPAVGPARRRAARREMLLAALAFLLFAAFVQGVVALCAMRQSPGAGLENALAQFFGGIDAPHYISLARYGYQNEWNETVAEQHLRIVFFPLFPWLLRALNAFGVLPWYVLGCAVQLPLFSGCGAALYALAAQSYGPRAAARACICLLAFPGTFFFALPMTESLFLLLCLGFFLLLQHGRPLAAGAAGFLCALARSPGALLCGAAAVWLWQAVRAKRVRLSPAYAVCVAGPVLGLLGYFLLNWAVFGDWLRFSEYQAQHWGQKLGFFWNTVAYHLDTMAQWWREGQRLNAVCVAGPVLGLLGYFLLNWAVFGDWLRFSEYQAQHWGQKLGFFWNTVAYHLDTMAQWWREGQRLNAVCISLLAVVCILYALGLLCAAAHRLQAHHLAFALAYVAFTMGATWLLSAPRYLAGCFALPCAAALCCQKRRWVWLCWLAAQAAVAAAYFAVYLRHGPVY